MMTQVLLTIDTELTWRHYARGAGWRENLAMSYDPAGAGVPYQLKQLARHGLRACFFVDPMPAMIYGLDPIRRMVEPILEAGQEVQLHLHPFWRDLAQGRRDDARFELTDFLADEQHELIVPARTAGNQRLFSFNDVERLLEIKSLIEKGVNIAGIKQVMNPVSKESEEATVITEQTESKRREMSDMQLHRMLKQQLLEKRPGRASLIQGQLSRFYTNK